MLSMEGLRERWILSPRKYKENGYEVKMTRWRKVGRPEFLTALASLKLAPSRMANQGSRSRRTNTESTIGRAGRLEVR